MVETLIDVHTNKKQRASRTAMMAAAHRYLSLFEPNPFFRTQDTLAKLFIPRLGRFLLGFA
jgi:O-methyltransferase involved in polyketide biosynthesis